MGTGQSAEHAGIRSRCGGRLSQAEGWLDLVSRPARKLGIQSDLRRSVARRALRIAVPLQVDFENRWRKELVVGRGLFLLGKSPRAIRHLGRAAVLCPDSRSAWRLLAACHRRTGDYASAVSVLGTATSHNPEDAFLHFDLARSLSLAGDVDRALVELQWALDLEPLLQKRLLRVRAFESLREHPEFQAICRETI